MSENTCARDLTVDGATLTVRPITIADIDRLYDLFGRLSAESVHSRFFSPIRRPPVSFMLRLAAVDHMRREALVALEDDRIVAVARYDAPAGAHEAEIAVTVADDWQHRGVGRRLAKQLACLAVHSGYDAFTATMLPDNRAALGLVHRLSPDATVRFAGGGYEATMPLQRAS